jgi:N-acetyl-1-D-myo-inositol-2-amino-2-deoxy-alpha-D-glucopyranoside deacetylase
MGFFIGLALALVAGIFGTVFHQTNLASVPIGLVLSLTGVTLLAIEARTDWPRRLGFLCLFLLVIIYSAQDFTGDKLIPANLAGTIWSYGSASLALVITLWPKLKR